MSLERGAHIQPYGWTRPHLRALCSDIQTTLERWADEETRDAEVLQPAIDSARKMRHTLSLLGTDGGASLVDAVGDVLQALGQDEARETGNAINLALQATAILPDYLDRLETGAADAPILLLPLINDLRASAGQSLLSEDSFFDPDLDRIVPPETTPGSADLKMLRRRYEVALLSWLKSDSPESAVAPMRAILKDLAASEHEPGPVLRMAWIGQVVTEGLEQGNIEDGPGLRKIFARLDVLLRDLAQQPGARRSAEDTTSLEERTDTISRGMLFHIALAEPGCEPVDTLLESAGLRDILPSRLELEKARSALTGRNRGVFASVAEAVQEELNHIKQELDVHLRGEKASPDHLQELSGMLDSIGETLSMLGLNRLSERVQSQAGRLEDLSGEANDPELLDVAHQLLLVESELDESIRYLGEAPEEEGLVPQESLLPDNERRRVMRQLIAEALEDLQQGKHLLDAIHRSEADASDAAQVANLLTRIAGAMEIGGLTEAAELANANRAFIQAEMLEADHLPERHRMEELAESLTDLEFYLESLPRMDGSGERFLLHARQCLAELGYWDETRRAGIVESGDDISEADEPDVPDADLTEPGHGTGPAHEDQPDEAEEDAMDFDVREIFLEELASERESLKENLARLSRAPHDSDVLTEMRRSFHTIKGSGRMVGATETGEFGWVVENLLNRAIEGRILPESIVDLLADCIEALDSLEDRLKDQEAALSEDQITEMIDRVNRIAEGEDPSRSAPGDTAANLTTDITTDLTEEPATTEEPEAMSQEDIDPTLIQLMVNELSENLETLDGYIEDANERGWSSPVSQDLVRSVHTMKGTLRLAPISDECEAAQEFEHYLNELAGQDDSPSAEGMACVQGMAELFRARLARLEGGDIEEDRFHCAELRAAIRRQMRNLHEASPSASMGDRAAAAESDQNFFQLPGDDELPDQVAGQSPTASDEASLFSLDEEPRDEEPEQAPELPEERIGEPEAPESRETADEALNFSEEAPAGDDFATFLDPVETGEDPADEIAPPPEDELALVPETDQVDDEHLTIDLGDESALEDEGLDPAGEDETADTPVESWDTLETLDHREDPEEESAFDHTPQDQQDQEAASDPSDAAPGEDEEAPLEEEEAPLLEIQEDDAEATIETEPVDEVAEPAEPVPAVETVTEIPVDYDELDDELVAIFQEEGNELLESSDELIQQWRQDLNSKAVVTGLQRNLHTIKGSARMAGFNPIGEVAHVMEELLEAIAGGAQEATEEAVNATELGCDHLHTMLSAIEARKPLPLIAAGELAAEADMELPEETLQAAEDELQPTRDTGTAEAATAEARRDTLRVDAELIDSLVNYAGEISIFRSRLEQQVSVFRNNVTEVDSTVIRLRDQLRKLEMETEAQILSRYEREHGAQDETFDPLELDRYSTIQQLSRALAESVSDLTSLTEILDDATRQSETLLMQQSRVNTELQEGLMQARLVAFSTLEPRLRRVLRNACRDTGKKANLDIRLLGESQLDRNILERVSAPLEHMLRNAIAHGIESAEGREAAGKPEAGTVVIEVDRESTEMVIRVSDDGAGLNVDLIRQKAIERNLIRADSSLSDDEVTQFIFESGFSTAASVSELAGRGVGLDVVANEIRQIGGSVYLRTEPGKGARFSIRIPLTLAVMQAIMVRASDRVFAIPLQAVRGVARMMTSDYDRVIAGANPEYEYAGENYALMELEPQLGLATPPATGNTLNLLMIQTGEERAAIRVTELLGHREIVIKPVGPQISSIPGILSGTVTGDGQVVLILDMGPLIHKGLTQYHHVDDETGLAAPATAHQAEQVKRTPLVMMVDDSITMRRITARVLENRELEVITAKDGLDAVEVMYDRIPDIILLDIEMPRMDGYELATHVRNDPRLKHIPMMMITSRSGEKHRQHARDVGVNRYLAKPYQEAELLKNVFEMLEMPAPEA